MKKLLFTSSLSLLLLLILPCCNKSKTVDQRCSQLPETGVCQAAFVRYYYDKEARECKSFIWGGCGEFPFKTLEECKSCGCDK